MCNPSPSGRRFGNVHPLPPGEGRTRGLSSSRFVHQESTGKLRLASGARNDISNVFWKVRSWVFGWHWQHWVASA
jgi:hypothetical protein